MIQTMSSKLTTNSQLSTTEPKNELSKQLEQNRIPEMEITWSVINRGVGRGDRGERYRE